MRKGNFLSAALLTAVVTIMVPAVNAATTVQVLGAGSSAMWTTAGIGAWKQLAGTNAQHYTIKGSGGVCTTNTNCAQIHDPRSASILPEGGSLWIVWSADLSKVWAYLSVDSVVGNRAYFGGNQLQIDPAVQTNAGANLISSGLWGNDALAVPGAVYTALNNANVTAGFTDIRPEDAKFAQCRISTALNTTNYSGLGYGTGCNTLIGTQVKSTWTSAVANPVAFNIKGTDPFTGKTVKAYSTVNVGAAPIVFVVNRTDVNGLGAGVPAAPVFTNLDWAHAQKLFNGTECDTNAFGASNPPPNTAVQVLLREPLSGTMNTTEFTVFRTSGGGPAPTAPNTPNNSQEVGVNPANANNNPLNLACVSGGGFRYRGIGTGEIIKGSGSVGGIQHITDSVGYAFFSYGNVSAIAGSNSYGYLTFNGVDPIQASYSGGQLPVCTSSQGSGICPAAPGTSFPNLRNGTYRAWSVLRLVTDATGINLTNAKLLVSAIQNNVNTTVPDFVPFNAVGGDPGLKFYRSHYLQSGVQPNNGLSGQKETGGDVGGCSEPVGPAPGVLSCHQ